MDVVENTFRELEKSIQKATIKSNGFSAFETTTRHKDKLKDNSKTQLSPMMSKLSLSTRALKGAVKGKFGQKLTYVLKKEISLLSDF